jgi:hypothetical protein
MRASLRALGLITVLSINLQSQTQIGQQFVEIHELYFITVNAGLEISEVENSICSYYNVSLEYLNAALGVGVQLNLSELFSIFIVNEAIDYIKRNGFNIKEIRKILEFTKYEHYSINKLAEKLNFIVDTRIDLEYYQILNVLACKSLQINDSEVDKIIDCYIKLVGSPIIAHISEFTEDTINKEELKNILENAAKYQIPASNVYTKILWGHQQRFNNKLKEYIINSNNTVFCFGSYVIGAAISNYDDEMVPYIVKGKDKNPSEINRELMNWFYRSNVQK